MTAKINIPFELKERHKLLVYFLGECGPLDRKALQELFSWALVLEQKAKEGVEILYDHLLNLPQADQKLPFKFNTTPKIFEQELFALTGMLGLIRRVNADYRARSTTAYELTTTGQKVFEVIASGRRPFIRPAKEQRRHIFVIGHFADPQIHKLYEKELAGAVIEVGFKPLRIEAGAKPEVISKTLIKDLDQAEALLVDQTFLAPALYFQLGFAYGVGVPVMFTCRHDARKSPDEWARQLPVFTAEDLQPLVWAPQPDGSFTWHDGITPEKRLRTIL
jgi:hypothetical protein